VARIVVVGAGVGGMAAAARLQVKRHQVTVVEASDAPGGALASRRRDGFTFDLGPNVFTLPAVYRDLFLKTGGALEASVELVPLDPGSQHRFTDGKLTLPGVGVGRTAEAMGLAFGERAADDWRALMTRAGQIWAAIRRPVLENAVASDADLRDLLGDRSTRRIVAARSTLRDLGRTLHDRRAGQVLDHYALQTGADPRTAPGSLVTLPYVEATFGAWHIAGGLGSLAEALRGRLEERGVTLLLGTRATRIVVRDGRITGVQVEAQAQRSADQPRPTEVLDADIVVTDLDPTLAAGLLGADAPRDRRTARSSWGAFQVLLAVRGRTPGVGHLTVWHPRDQDAELDALSGRRPRLAAHPTIRACVPDDPAMRPADHESWTLEVTAPRHSRSAGTPGTVDWDVPGLAQRYADDLLAELAARGGPDLRDRILWREVRTPADHERRTGAPGGATHGSTTRQRGLVRHVANVSPQPGLFHVGASAHPGSGLPLVGLSAELVATLIGRA
jgi:phytoene desaturase